MSYLVLARKYRPSTFRDVSGQDHVTRTLQNSIDRGKVAHAYLFCGPRGVGKTSIARIFAKALNCQKGPTAEPCQVCVNCKEITDGNSLAVREIDGASHNSVDHVRDLIDSFRSVPPPGSRNKVYIIDEVHMLSGSAFNALLKSLEEPPPNTVFLMATTEAHKIPETVISRCQRFDFRAMGHEDIIARLAEISAEEKMQVESEVFRMIARSADGSMRDSQSLLDRVHSFCDGDVTAEEAGKVLGVVDRQTLFRLSQAVFSRNPEQALEIITKAFELGLDPALFMREFAAHWRELLLAAFQGESILVQLGLNEAEAQQIRDQAVSVGVRDLQDLVDMARDGADSALRSTYPKYALESLVVRMATREPVKELGQLIGGLRKLVSGGGGGGRGAEQVRKSAAARENIVQVRVDSGETADKRFDQLAEADALKSVDLNSSEPKQDSGSAPDVEKRNLGGDKVFNWEAFVDYAADQGANILTEQLRRLSAVSFEAGVVRAEGPEFSVEYLQRKINLRRWKKLLQGHTGLPDWRFDLESREAGKDGLGSDSLSEVQRRREKEQRKQRERELIEAPGVQSFQKAFPGSKIESFRLKED